MRPAGGQVPGRRSDPPGSVTMPFSPGVGTSKHFSYSSVRRVGLVASPPAAHNSRNYVDFYRAGAYIYAYGAHERSDNTGAGERPLVGPLHVAQHPSSLRIRCSAVRRLVRCPWIITVGDDRGVVGGV